MNDTELRPTVTEIIEGPVIGHEPRVRGRPARIAEGVPHGCVPGWPFLAWL